MFERHSAAVVLADDNSHQQLIQPSSTVLGRRQRSQDSEDDEGREASIDAQQPEDEPRRKRIRTMRLGDSESSNSNGTSRPNGSGPSPLHKAALSANGAHKAVMNGSSSLNGHSVTKQRATFYGHDREEVTRILIQSLTDMGYNSAATHLSQESGYDLESPVVTAFRSAVLQGEWTEAEELLFGVSTEQAGANINRNGLELQPGADMNVMKFELRRQKFLELLEQQDTGRALMVLRLELTPLYQDTAKLHFLSRY